MRLWSIFSLISFVFKYDTNADFSNNLIDFVSDMAVDLLNIIFVFDQARMMIF